MSTALKKTMISTQTTPAVLRGRKSDAVYHAIKRDILLGEIEADQSLTEQNIGAQLGCSQGTVREALMSLERDGLVRRLGYRGTVVTATSLEEAAQMTQIRLSIECAGVSASTGKLNSTKRDTLRGILDEKKRARDQGDAYLRSELDREFHLELFRASGMLAMEPILRRCALHMHRFTFTKSGRRRFDHVERVGQEHRQILEEVENGNPEAAATAIRDHVLGVIAGSCPELYEAIKAIRSLDRN